jgi:hypothetical protein
VFPQHYWEAVWLFGADNIVEPPDVPFKDVTVEKEQGIQGLILGRGADMSVNGQRREKLRHLLFAHVSRVTLSMEEGKALDPVNIGLFSPQAVMPQADRCTDLIEQLGLVAYRSVPLCTAPL